MQPFEKNKAILGLDAGSEKRRRAAIEKSMVSAMPIISEKFEMARNNNVDFGYVIYYPLYKTAKPPLTEELRVKDFVGVTSAPISASAFIDYIKSRVSSKINFNIRMDGTDQYLIKSFDDVKHNPDVVQKRIILGKKWVVSAIFNESISLVKDRYIVILFSIFLSLAHIIFVIYLKRLYLRKNMLKNKVFEIENCLNSVMENIPLGIISTDIDGKIKTINKSAQLLLGLSLEHKMNLSSLSEGENNKAEELSYQSASGKTILVRQIVAALYDKNKMIEGYIFILEDITEFKTLEKEIETQKIMMLQNARLSSLGEMASGVAHEINNPLAIIGGLSSYLKTRVENDDININTLKDDLGNIDSAVARITKIINELHDLSKKSNGSTFEIILFKDVVENLLALCRDRFLNCNINLIVDVDSKVMVKTKGSQIGHAILNLLNNSFDALNLIDNQNEKWIKVQTVVEVNVVKISIIDSGRGIDPRVAERMMEPFYTTKKIGMGTGVGLSLSKNIIENHGGHLYYDSESPNTCFVIELPIFKYENED